METKIKEPSLRIGDYLPDGLWVMINATRPWSLPASVCPILLITFVNINKLAENEQDISLVSISWRFLMCILVVAFLHLCANIHNTIEDFCNKIDSVEKSTEDRTLVDNHLSYDACVQLRRNLLLLSGCCLIPLITLHPSPLVKSRIIQIVSAACIFSFWYSYSYDHKRRLKSLKSCALGDVSVFIVFGPLVALFVKYSVFSILSDDHIVTSNLEYGMLASLFGVQAVAILHSNNMRDFDTDQNVGVMTIAHILGRGISPYYFYGLIGVQYLLIVGMMLLNFGSWRLGLVICCLPWSIYLIRMLNKFYGTNHLFLRDLPKKTAQHNLFFVTLVGIGYASPQFLARFLLGILFYLGGVNNILMFNYQKFLVCEKLINICPVIFKVSEMGTENQSIISPFGPYNVKLASIALAGTIMLQTPTSIMFILGIYPKANAVIMLLFLIPVTLTVHDFWSIEDDLDPPARCQSHPKKNAVNQRQIPTFPTQFDSEFVHFFKNIGMIGGLVAYLVFEQESDFF